MNPLSSCSPRGMRTITIEGTLWPYDPCKRQKRDAWPFAISPIAIIGYFEICNRGSNTFICTDWLWFNFYLVGIELSDLEIINRYNWMISDGMLNVFWINSTFQRKYLIMVTILENLVSYQQCIYTNALSKSLKGVQKIYQASTDFLSHSFLSLWFISSFHPL